MANEEGDDSDVRKKATEDFIVFNRMVKSAYRNERLSPLQSMLIQYLALMKPGATPGEISKEYEMEPDHTAKVLKGLRSAGFVAAVPDEKDGRVKHYYNTVAGSVEVASALLARGFYIEPKDLPHVTPSTPKVKGS